MSQPTIAPSRTGSSSLPRPTATSAAPTRATTETSPKETAVPRVQPTGQDFQTEPDNVSLGQACLPRGRPPRQPIDYGALRQQVSMAEVLALVRFQPASRRGDQVRGKCPIHVSDRDRSRVFSANLRRNVYQCFSPRCASKGNQLDLYVAWTGLSLYDAAIDLCAKLGIDVPYLAQRRGTRTQSIKE